MNRNTTILLAHDALNTHKEVLMSIYVIYMIWMGMMFPEKTEKSVKKPD